MADKGVDEADIHQKLTEILDEKGRGRTKVYSLSDRFLGMWLSRTY